MQSRRNWLRNLFRTLLGGTVAVATMARPRSATAQTTYVDTTSDQTIGGIKTFTSPPVVPADAFPQTAVSGLVAALEGKQATIPPGTYIGPDVRAYGATGNGTTDDTAAIQAAIDAHSLVYFPAGVYRCNSSLRLRTGSRLVGEGYTGSSSTPVAQIDSRVVGLSSSPWALRILAGSAGADSGVIVENLWIKGNERADHTGSGFPSYGVYGGSQVSDLTIRNSTISGFNYNVFLQDLRRCRLETSILKNAVNGNLVLYGQCREFVAIDCEMIVVNELGIAAAGASLQNIWIRDRADGTLYSSRITIQNCVLDEVAETGQAVYAATIRIDRSTDVTVADTLLYVPVGARGGYGVKVGAGCERITLRDVRVEPYVADGRHVPVQTILIDAAASAVALNNVSTVPNGGGDIADHADDTHWSNVNGITRVRSGITVVRPLATTAGQGAMFFDETLGKPLWSDGNVWRDAMGTTAFDLQAAGQLVVWYDASQLALRDKDVVGTWPDGSGSSRPLNQTTVGQKPTFVSSGQNGRPVVRFNGTSTYMFSATFTLAQPLTLFLAGKVNTTSHTPNLIDGLTLHSMVIQRGPKWSIYAGSFVTDGESDSSFHVHCGVFNGTASKLYVDGGPGALGNAGTRAPGGVTVGSSSGGGSLTSGDYAEVIIYEGALSVNAINSVGAYLAEKYGTTWNAAT